MKDNIKILNDIFMEEITRVRLGDSKIVGQRDSGQQNINQNNVSPQLKALIIFRKSLKNLINSKIDESKSPFNKSLDQMYMSITKWIKNYNK